VFEMPQAVKVDKMYKNFRAMIFNSETNTFHVEKVVQIVGDKLETENDLYPIQNAVRYVNETDGHVVYVFNVDLPAKVEAQNLKLLRRSAALSRIFDYQVAKPFDIFKFMPWVAIILLILFK
jgi:hypothetical protein